MVRCLQDSDEREAGSGLLPAIALVATWLSMLPDPLVDDGSLSALLQAPQEQQPALAQLLLDRSAALSCIVQCVIATGRSGAHAADSLKLIWSPMLFRQHAAVNMLLQLPSLVAVVTKLVQCQQATDEQASTTTIEPQNEEPLASVSVN